MQSITKDSDMARRPRKSENVAVISNYVEFCSGCRPSRDLSTFSVLVSHSKLQTGSHFNYCNLFLSKSRILTSHNQISISFNAMLTFIFERTSLNTFKTEENYVPLNLREQWIRPGDTEK